MLAMLSPGRIVFGGGVMGTPGLLDRVRLHAEHFAGGYLAEPGTVSRIIQPPHLDADVGLRGALLLAKAALGR